MSAWLQSHQLEVWSSRHPGGRLAPRRELQLCHQLQVWSLYFPQILYNSKSMTEYHLPFRNLKLMETEGTPPMFTL